MEKWRRGRTVVWIEMSSKKEARGKQRRGIEKLREEQEETVDGRNEEA